MRYIFLPVVASALLLQACNSDVASPDALRLPSTIALGKSTTTANATATWKLPLSSAGLGLISDGLYSDGASSVYDSGVCGVTAQIFNVAGSESGDATLQTNNPTAKANNCAAYPRRMTVVYPTADPVYPNGASETMAVFLNARNIANATTVIHPGYSNRVRRPFALNPTQTTRCDAWRWNSSVGGNDVWVERMDDRTYHVYTADRDPDANAASAAAGENMATCTTTGQQHHLSVDLFIVSKQALPL